MSKDGPFIDFLKVYLGHCPDAYNWICGYFLYAHSIDDIVDKDNDSPEFILKTFRLAISVYTFPFYQQYCGILRPLCEAAHDSYRDSVLLENHPKEWARSVADIIRSNAVDVVLAVICIVAGVDKRNEAAIKLREISYNTHHNEKGLPT